MASYDINRINVDTLKQYCSSFASEKENYGNEWYDFLNNKYKDSALELENTQ